MTIEERELSADQIRAMQRELAAKVGMTVEEVYAGMERGDFRGTILESELHMLKFLLGGHE